MDRDFTEPELREYLDQFAWPNERVDFRKGQLEANGTDAFWWDFFGNLKRNCERLDVPVPAWLDSIVARAPATEASAPVVFAGADGE